MFKEDELVGHKLYAENKKMVKEEGMHYVNMARTRMRTVEDTK